MSKLSHWLNVLEKPLVKLFHSSPHSFPHWSHGQVMRFRWLTIQFEIAAIPSTALMHWCFASFSIFGICRIQHLSSPKNPWHWWWIQQLDAAGSIGWTELVENNMIKSVGIHRDSILNHLHLSTCHCQFFLYLICQRSNTSSFGPNIWDAKPCRVPRLGGMGAFPQWISWSQRPGISSLLLRGPRWRMCQW